MADQQDVTTTPLMDPIARESDRKFAHGLPTTHTTEIEEEYTRFRLRVYKERADEWKGNLLREFYKEDFETFTQGMFRSLPNDLRRDLRKHLLDYGVYVPVGPGVKIHQALFQVLQHDLDWPEKREEISKNAIHELQVGETTLNCGTHDEVTLSATQIHDRETSSNDRQRPLLTVSPKNTIPTHSTSSAHSSHAISSMMKAYSHDTHKYSGALADNFERKYKIFEERCEQCSVSDQDKPRAFSLMLCGIALEYYFTHVKHLIPDMDKMVCKVKERFLTEERTLAMIHEWDATSLSKTIRENPSLSKKDCLDKMVARLQELQICLPIEYRSDLILKNKLLIACADIEECRLARQKVSSTVEGVIADLHTSISTAIGSSNQQICDKSNSTALLTALLTERKRYNRFNGRSQKGKICYVCRKPGCWSKNHSAEERIAAFRKSKRFKAYIANVLLGEVSEDDDDSDEAEAFNVELDYFLNSHSDKEESGDPYSNFTDVQAMFTAELQDSATAHAISKKTSHPRSRRYERGEFHGIAIDTCCSYHSVAGYEQYAAYCSFVGTEVTLDDSRSSRVGFGMGNTRSKGIAVCRIPIGELIISISVHVVDADIPILLFIADVDKHKLVFDNTKDILKHIPTGAVARVERKFGHPFIVWNPFLQCFFTKSELARLHRRFGHPTTDKLINVLRRIEPEKLDRKTRSRLEKIVEYCKLCQYHSQKPRRFKFTLREDKNFNQVVYVDVVTIDKKQALHVVDEATRYQAARWLPTMSAEDVWRSLRMCWIDVYLGPPEVVAHDAGKNFIARAFQTNAGFMSIDTKPIPVESPNTMTFVERYHAPLRRAYSIIRTELPNISEEEVLQYSVKSLNDSVGPDGLVPTLLVYGALPRLGFPTDKPAKGIYERAVAVRKASEQMSRYFAKRQLKEAMRCRNGPELTKLHKAPIGSRVLVYRTKSNSWEGPFTLLNIDGETCTIQCSDGPQQFRTTTVKVFKDNAIPRVGMKVQVYWPADKQFYSGRIEYVDVNTGLHRIKYDDGDLENLDLSKENWHELHSSKIDATPNALMTLNMCCVVDSVSKNDIDCLALRGNRLHEKRFEKSREKEILGLIERGVFEPVHKSKALGHRIYGSRFVDQIKNEGSDSAYEKSRLVVQGYNDRDHGLLTHAPTVQRSSQRLLFAMACLLPNWQIYLRDITQAYTQSMTKLYRKVFVKPVQEFGLSEEMVLKVHRPLYGIPEAGLHWFNTYHAFHTKDLKMTASYHDLCLLFTKDGPNRDRHSKPAALTCLQTDDSLFLANKVFEQLEDQKSTQFERKRISRLVEGVPLKFNGIIVNKHAETITIRAAVSSHDKLAKIDYKSVNCDEYVAQRARGAYIASICRPDLMYGFASAAQHSKPSSINARALNKTITRCLDSSKQGLRFVTLDSETLYLGVFIDASFANNSDYSSQLGFLTTLMDDNNNCNIVHFGSMKCKRVTRSALASELYSMVYGFDQSYVIKVCIEQFLNRSVPLRLYTDSRSLFDSLVTLNTTAEKRLLIDLSMLRESYQNREIADVFWIPTKQNPADGLTKKGECEALSTLLNTNKANITPSAWIERPDPKWSHPRDMRSTNCSLAQKGSPVSVQL